MLRLTVAPKSPDGHNTRVVDPQVLGERIKELRRKRKWTQKDLAAAAHVTENTIRGLEHGTMQTRRPKYEAIVAALGTTTELLERADQPITDDHPLLVGLNDQDLQIAQAYSRARTTTRLRVERLLLTNTLDAGFAIGDRVLALDDTRRERLLQALTLAETARHKELDAQKKKPTP